MTKTKRPAEQLVADFQSLLDTSTKGDKAAGREVLSVYVSTSLLKHWLKLAKSVDARMRLDGSRLNKRKSAGAGRKRVKAS